MTLEAHDVEARDGTRLRLWEASAPEPGRAVLFVHGATYASRAIFAPRGAAEHSWLRWVAESGDAGFAVDLRGYGDSEQPPALRGDPADAAPAVRAATAAGDLADALAAVRERVDRPVHLVGTSWGTVVAGRLLAGADPPRVASASFHAPVYRPPTGLLEGFDDGAFSRAFRTVDREGARERWDDQLPPGEATRYRGGDGGADPVFEAFWRTLAASEQGRDRGDGRIVAPNGTLLDMRAGVEGDPVYDPAGIDVPTLVVRGSLDPTSTRADALGLYDELSVPGEETEYAEVAGGSHFVHLERRRGALYDVVDRFQGRY